MRLGKLIAILMLLCPVMAHATGCPTGYAYAKQFVVDYHYVSSTLTNFPVYVAFNGNTTSTTGTGSLASQSLPDMKSAANGGKSQSLGLDFVFCDAYSGGNLLNFERAQWSATTGQAEFWVGDTLSSTANTSFWMFYGKASDTDHSAAAALWSAAGYTYVQHYADGSTLSVTDSTGNTTPVNHSGTAATGQAGGAVAVASASTQYVQSSTPVNPGSSLTLEAWVNQTAFSGCQMVADNSNFVAGSGYFLGIGAPSCGSNGNVQFLVCSVSGCGTTTQKVSAAVSVGAWNFVAGTMTGTSSTNMHLYINGAEPSPSSSATGGGVGTSANNLTTGAASNLAASRYFNGKIDEFRVANVVQSSAWESMNYYQMLANFGVLTMVDADFPASMTSGAYCVPLTINHAQVPNTDQTNYPLLVRGIYGWMADTAHGGFAVVGNSGKDIRFYSNSGCTTAMDFQRIYWTNTTGDSSWKVRIPSLSHTADTTVYVRIGSSLDTTDLSIAWQTAYGYVGLYNGGSPTALDGTDSGSAAFPMICGASVTAATVPTGGGFYLLPNTDNSGGCGAGPTTSGDTLAAHGYPVGSVKGHIRMWFRTTPTDATGSPTDVVPGGYGKANSTGARDLDVRYSSTACLVTGLQETQYSIPGPGITALGPSAGCSPSASTPFFQQDLNWHVWDLDQPSNGAPYSSTAMYLDGVKITSPVYYGTSTGSTVLNTADAACCSGNSEIRLGRMAAHGVGWFQGFVGMFEVTNFTESQDYVQTRYNNEVSPGAFYSFGAATPFIPASSNQPIVSVIL